jgi:hypothetical protein
MVRNGIPRVCFYFSSTERNSELFSLPLKGSEGNSESMLLFLVHGTEFRVVFSSAEGFGTEFRDFLFRGIAGIPSEITLCSVYSVFRGIIFLSEIPNPICICSRILQSASKNSKKNLDSYCFVPSCGLFIFEKLCKCTFKKQKAKIFLQKFLFCWHLEGQ